MTHTTLTTAIRLAVRALPVAALILSGCSFFGLGPMSAGSLAQVASAANDYHTQALLASMGRLEVEDLEASGSGGSQGASHGSSPGYGPQTVTVDESTHTLPDGTIVTITRLHDDRDTPSDPTDDLLTVTRSFELWEGATKIHQIERPLRPDHTAVWGWVASAVPGISELAQAGTVEVFVEGIKIKSGTVDITWRRDDASDDVWVYQVDTELIGIGPGAAITRTVITVEAGLQTKTVYRIRVENGTDIVVHSFTFEEFDDNGEILTKIIRDDGWYVIVREKRAPRILEHYDPDDVMRLRSVTERDPVTGRRTTIREHYDADGNLVAVRELQIRIQFLGDQIIVTKTFDTGRTVDVILTETDNGYRITRSSFTYLVVFTDEGVELYTEDGALIGTVIFLADGDYRVVFPDGESERVAL